MLDYQVIKTDDDLKQDLFLTSSDFVYKIRRLRLLDDQPFLIETGFIPIKIAPDLNPDILKKSLFNYLEHQKNKRVTKSFLTITVEPSTLEDQVKLMLEPNEPVGIIEGIFFLDDGTPFEVSNMRVHYKYMKYNSFVNLNK
ncbi:UbiC transcription regulator-associated domain protein [Lactobacillus iners LactinV 11V1-d]|nr:UbiC transcription regulator-associated domain protein [Lactobacillus iners LactinV 11V1-d]EFO69422.1 UbiC transcription regulator-associated domain protein [Lactobacillus iners LactinV 03V1-b]